MAVPEQEKENSDEEQEKENTDEEQDGVEMWDGVEMEEKDMQVNEEIQFSVEAQEMEIQQSEGAREKKIQHTEEAHEKPQTIAQTSNEKIEVFGALPGNLEIYLICHFKRIVRSCY